MDAKLHVHTRPLSLNNKLLKMKRNKSFEILLEQRENHITKYVKGRKTFWSKCFVQNVVGYGHNYGLNWLQFWTFYAYAAAVLMLHEGRLTKYW